MINERLLGKPLLLGAAALLCAYTVVRTIRRRSKGPLPPGPRGLPVVGNVNDLPPPGQPEWTHWLKHKDLYGPISSITVMGQTLILIHDREIAAELMDKRALNSSDRPDLTFAGDLIGYTDMMIMQKYNPVFRQQRKVMATQVGNKSVLKFQEVQEATVRRLLRMVLDNPTELSKNLQNASGSLMLQLLFGYAPGDPRTDSLAALMNQVAIEFSSATTPGTWLVDALPFLKYMPEWMPGSGFKQTAHNWQKDLHRSVYEPYEFVREQMTHGVAPTSYVSGLIQDIDRPISHDEMMNISWSAAALFAGGTDTAPSSMHAFFLAMILFPEVQEKIHAEIEQVVGTLRLPSLSDRPNLPYVEAAVQELLRWNSVGPMGFPHTVVEDDWYEGYYIPKGAIMMTSIVHLCRDPSVYHEAEVFKPERFSAPYNEPTATDVAWGFGRRVCPGRWMADQTLFITIAQSMAAFKFSKAVDEQGNVIEPKREMTPGVLSHIKPYPYQVAPRSETYRQLVAQQ